MNVNPEKLLHHLEASLGKSLRHEKARPAPGMSGEIWECPLHPDGNTCLTATSGPRVVFSCLNPACRFRGDAASLVALVRDIPIQDAVSRFGEDGELAGCMDAPMAEEDIRAYLETVDSQAVLKAYLAKCRQALRQTPEKAGIRAGMSRTSLRLLHPDIGLFLDEPGVPKCLREFQKPKYRKSCVILYPYTMNGEVTRIEALDSTDPGFRMSVVVTHPEAGAFGEELARGMRTVVAVERPETAARLYAAYAAGSTNTPPVVAFSGYPLSEEFMDVARIQFFSSTDEQVSERMLLKTLSAPDIRAGRPPAMQVANWMKRMADLKFQDISSPKESGAAVSDLQYTLARRFTGMLRENKAQKVLEILGAEQTPAAIRSLIKSTAAAQLDMKGGLLGDSEATGKLVSLLDTSSSERGSDLSLANGKVVHSGPDGVFAIRADDAHELLCNVGLAVDTRIVAEDEFGEAFECTAAARGGFPAVKLRFRWQDLTADRMRTVVQKAYGDLGLSPYVAFYSAAGYSWRDIMSKLAENCQVEKAKPINLEKKVTGNSVELKPIGENQ